MSTTLATQTHYAPHTRVPLRPVGGPIKSTRAKRSEPPPKPKPTAAAGRRTDNPKTEQIEVVFDERHAVPKLVTEYTPTSSPGPLTPPTPPAGHPAPIRSKHSRSSLRPPTDQHSSWTTIHRPRPHYAYTPDVKPDLKTLNDKGRDTRYVTSDVKPDVHEPAEERIRDLKSLEAYGVRFVPRTDDMRGTQVLAGDADFAVDVAYLSRVSNLSSTASTT